MAYLETGEAWDTQEAYLEFVQKQGHGIVNIEIHNQLFCKELENRHPKLL